MRRIFNLIDIVVIGGVIFALTPAASALAGKTNNDKSSTCSSSNNDPSCNCMPLTTFTASGTGVAIDDLYADPTTAAYLGCYAPGSADPYLLNDNQEVACPTPGNNPGSQINLSCGCYIAGGNMPNGGEDVTLVGDAQHGNWKLKQLELSFAFGDNTATSENTFFIGNPNGTAAGTNGGRCYGAAGFALLESEGTSSGSVAGGQIAYLDIQGTVCDSMYLDHPQFSPPTSEPQKGSFTGNFILDASRSSSYFTNYTSTGTIVIAIDDVSSTNSAGLSEYSAASFSLNGYMNP
jgi:hypothetical protein